MLLQAVSRLMEMRHRIREMITRELILALSTTCAPLRKRRLRVLGSQKARNAAPLQTILPSAKTAPEETAAMLEEG